MAKRQALQVGSDIEIEAGPFAGVVDSPDPNQARPDRLFAALNMTIPDPVRGSAVVARHGFQGQVQQLGSAGSRTGQGVFLHRRTDGTIDRFTFGGGKMYRWDGLDTYADITPVGIQISESNPIFCATYNDEILISDESNRPWIYSPSTGAAETIDFNDADEEWATKGGFVIYSGFPVVIVKAVGSAIILAENGDTIISEDGLELQSELTSGYQNTIAWGNANDPRTGYDQGDYDHLWQLTQTSGEVLGSLAAEEGALVYLRNIGIGYLTGAVNENFRGSATKDTISTTAGTDAPAAVVQVNRRIFFVDLDGRVHRCAVAGGEPEELWFPVRREVEEHFGTEENRENVRQYARGSYHPEYGLVLFTIWDRQTIYAFSAVSGQYVGQWQVLGGIHVDAMGALVDTSNRHRFVILGTRGTVYEASAQGVVWLQKHADDAMRWLDQADKSVATHTAFERAMETHWLSHGGARIYQALEAIAELLGDTSRHAVRLQYTVPKTGRSAALTAQSSAVTGVENSEDAISTARWGLGRNAQGGAIRVRISANHSDNVRFGVHSLLVKAIVTKTRAKAA